MVVYHLFYQVVVNKKPGESLGVMIVESGWGSMIPTAIIAHLAKEGPAAKSGRLNVGDQILSVNNTSLVGLPLPECQTIIKVSCQSCYQDCFCVSIYDILIHCI